MESLDKYLSLSQSWECHYLYGVHRVSAVIIYLFFLYKRSMTHFFSLYFTVCAWMAESFPRGARLTSVAIGYNLAQALIGGSSPAIATYLVDTYGIHSPGYLLSAVAVLSVSGLLFAPKRTDINRESIEMSYEHVDSRDSIQEGTMKRSMTVNGEHISTKEVNTVFDLDDVEELEGTFTID